MSKEKSNNKKKFNFKDKSDVIIAGLVGVIIGLLVGILVMNLITGSNNKQNNPVIDNSNTNITTYLYDHEILEGEQLTQACDTIVSRIDAIRTSNSYLQIQVGEYEFDTYIYNTKGECFAQSSTGAFTAVTNSNGDSFKLDATTSSVIVEKDLDVLSLMRNVATLAKNNTENFDFYNMIMSEGDASTVEYRIDVKGADAFKATYALFDVELAETMLNNITASMGTEWEPHFIYSFIISENDMSMCCYLIDNGEEYINWYCQGYLTLGDWQLSDAWYTLDVSNLSYDTVYALVETTLIDLETLIQNYALEHGLVTQEEIDAENNTNTDESVDETIAEDTETNTSSEISETITEE